MEYEYEIDLIGILLENKAHLYANMKQLLVETDDFFDIEFKQFFSGINMITIDGINLLDYIDDMRFLSGWIAQCIVISSFLIHEDKETICKFFRLFYIFPIFNDSPYTSTTTKSTGTKNLLIEQLKDVIPSADSTMINEDDLKGEFRVLERMLIESWCNNKTKRGLISLFNTCLRVLGRPGLGPTVDANKSEVQFGIVSCLIVVIKTLVSGAGLLVGDSIDFRIELNGSLKCPAHKGLNNESALEGCITYSDIIFKPQWGAIKTLTTLEVKPSDLIHFFLMDFQTATSGKESVAVFKEVVAQALCSQHMPIFLHDGQNLLMFDITEDQYTPVIDGEGNVRIPFKYFKIEHTSIGSNRYKSSTSINALVLLLLSVLDVSSNSTRLVELSKFIIKDARQRREIYIKFLETSKDESYLGSDSWSTMNRTEVSPSSSSLDVINSQINEIENHVKLESKRVYTSERIPVLHEHQGSSEQNSMVTLVVDAKLIAAILNINEPVLSNKVIMKISSIDASHAYYHKKKQYYVDRKGNQMSLETFLSRAYHKDFLNELLVNLFIDEYNQKCSREDLKIRKPKILGYGEIMSSNYRGFYFIEEYLDFIDNKPKTESHIQNGLDQLKILHSLGVAHLDIDNRNLCLDDNDQVWLIDFGQSTIISERDRRQHEFSDTSKMTHLK